MLANDHQKKRFSRRFRKPGEVRTWYPFEGPLGEVVHNKRFFFAWKEGCLMGTYNTLEEATKSLASEELDRAGFLLAEPKHLGSYLSPRSWI
jgi:hypothetical protein